MAILFDSATSRAFRLLDHPAICLGLTAFALHLWVNGSYGYFRDELYFIVCGRHPAWGYTDQPPLTPLIAAASDAAFHSLRGLRLIPAMVAARRSRSRRRRLECWAAAPMPAGSPASRFSREACCSLWAF